MPRLTVTAVTNVNDWQSQHGTMLGWTLNVTHPDGHPETITINSKPDRKYQIGDSFDAERSGREYKGVFQYQRVQGGFGGNQGQGASQPVQTPTAASNARGNGFSMGGGASPRSGMPYADAVALYAKVATDVNEPGHATTLFLSVLKGDIENPMKPKAVVRFLGNDIETAGIEQAAFDEVMALSAELAKETDDKNVRALLIATCGVQTRKALTADKARLFIETLKVNIAAVKKPEPEVPWPGESPEDY